MPESLNFRAHARLLTMLGEQLIKNERIALVELVKNSYDADATRVFVDFRKFGSGFESHADSSIVITDNGFGMSEQLVRTVWMNPATPSKAIKKTSDPRTPLGRVIQGEKGIGRFATFKLGTQVSLTTRESGTDVETTLLVDISDLGEAAESSARKLDYYLDDLQALIDATEPVIFKETGGKHTPEAHGTQLEIRGLRVEWTEKLVREAFADLDRLQPQLWGVTGGGGRADFEVVFLKDGVDLRLGSERTEEFESVLERAVLRVTDGRYDDVRKQFVFKIGDRGYELGLGEGEISGLKRFRNHFRNADGSLRDPECGPFEFEFFIFDFSPQAPAQFSLGPGEKDILRQHRIYLYRDGIRVYPYGDPKDDWLEIDAIRGTDSARSMFSNDQSVGFVAISQALNPNLRDKTNREGLLESGLATQDFIVLIQTVLSYLRAKPFEQYAAANRRVREKALKEHRIDNHIQSLRNDFQLPAKARAHLDALEAALDAERELSAMQVARTEQLAGVGLSVETASHDLITAGTEALRIARQVVSELRLHELVAEPVFAIATSLVTRLEFINSRFKDVQGLFVSSRQKQTRLDVAQLTRRVRAMYEGLHKHEHISFDIDEPLSLMAVSTEAAVLQCLINLVDNSTYWLMSSSQNPRIIRAFVADGHSLVISDNGPGVREEDKPFIFEAFYSGKGESGKGLGLYIARQNGLRNGFSIDLGAEDDVRTLPGATFVMRFAETGM